MNTTHVAFVSDGNRYQILGILMILNELLHSSINLNKDKVIWVGLPVEYHNSYKKYFDYLRNYVSIRFFPTKIFENDRYYVKLGLINLVKQLPKEDNFLYLDYDHLILNSFDIDEPSSNCINVSSEVKKLNETIVHTNNLNHYNNSLIISSVSTIRKLANDWLEIYHRLILPPEKREEISFNLAAELNMIDLSPVRIETQSYIGSDVYNSSLFHYGGNSSVSKKLKEYLKNISYNFDWENFDTEKLHKEHKKMIYNL